MNQEMSLFHPSNKYILSTTPCHFLRKLLAFHYHDKILEVVRKALFWQVVLE